MWPFRRKRRGGEAPDPSGMVPVFPEGYDDIDRYRDFRAVFAGESTPEQGRRVLQHILGPSLAHYWQSSMAADPHRTAFREGERNVALKILTILQTEPNRRATKAAIRPRPKR